MPTRKNAFKAIGKRLDKASRARPEKAGKYAARAMMNIGQGTAALAGGVGSLLSGDIEGAGRGAHIAANKIIGGKNLREASKATLGKKATEKITKGVKAVNRGTESYNMAKEGNIEGAAKRGLGKKAYDKVNNAPENAAGMLAKRMASAGGGSSADDRVSKHLARAKHHSDRAQLYHAALSGAYKDARAADMSRSSRSVM